MQQPGLSGINSVWEVKFSGNDLKQKRPWWNWITIKAFLLWLRDLKPDRQNCRYSESESNKEMSNKSFVSLKFESSMPMIVCSRNRHIHWA